MNKNFGIGKDGPGSFYAFIGDVKYSWASKSVNKTPGVKSFVNSRALGPLTVASDEIDSLATAAAGKSLKSADFVTSFGKSACGRHILPEYLDGWLKNSIEITGVDALKSASQEAGLTNCVHVHPDLFHTLSTTHGHLVKIKKQGSGSMDLVLTLVAMDVADDSVVDMAVRLNGQHRTLLGAEVGKHNLTLTSFDPSDCHLGKIVIELNWWNTNVTKQDKVKSEAVVAYMQQKFSHHVFMKGQKILMSLPNVSPFQVATVIELEDSTAFEAEVAAGITGTGAGKGDANAQSGSKAKLITVGQLRSTTEIVVRGRTGSPLKVTGSSTERRMIFNPNWNFVDMGIGGLDTEFSQIFRRAFASRVLSVKTLENLGIQHVKGMLLYGPPGTGKTLIARQIGKMLVGKEPKVVNGPEILNKYVGASEEKVRELFADAAKDYADNGENAELHIIILDEIDAICKTRGSSRDSTGVHDTVVNQLLSMIDGVNSLNNILVIGMTNRKDMIDEALLRPGRLEVQVEISLPDESGREQIFQIHTKKMRDSGLIDMNEPDLEKRVNIQVLAERAKNFSGAEIEGLVKSAASFASNRVIDAADLTKKVNEDAIRVTMADFELAFDEVKPAFGVSDDTVDRLAKEMIEYGSQMTDLLNQMKSLFNMMKSEKSKSQLVSLLLTGAAGSGKTTVATRTAIDSEFPFVKIVSAESFVGVTENGKCNLINKIFEDAYKSPLSVIIIDDLERLVDYVPSAPVRFSNTVLQAIMTLVKKDPPKDHKLLIIGTISHSDMLRDLLLIEKFDMSLVVPELKPEHVGCVLDRISSDDLKQEDVERIVQEITSGVGEIPVKKLYLAMEMANASLGTGGEGGGEEEAAYLDVEGDIVERFMDSLKRVMETTDKKKFLPVME